MIWRHRFPPSDLRWPFLPSSCRLLFFLSSLSSTTVLSFSFDLFRSLSYVFFLQVSLYSFASVFVQGIRFLLYRLLLSFLVISMCLLLPCRSCHRRVALSSVGFIVCRSLLCTRLTVPLSSLPTRRRSRSISINPPKVFRGGA